MSSLRDNISGLLLEALEEDAGIILCLHNVSIAAPQIITTLDSSSIIELLQQECGSIRNNSSGRVLKAGGSSVAAPLATFVVSRVYLEGAEAGSAGDI
jgi:solute carrier family 45, member 1/2/4